MVVVFVPRETEPGEARVASIPETVKGLVKLGLHVQVENGAGLAAGFADASTNWARAPAIAPSDANSTATAANLYADARTGAANVAIWR